MFDGAQDYFYIQPSSVVFEVIEVVSQLFAGVVDRPPVMIIDLREAGEAGFRDEAEVKKRHGFFNGADELRPLGTRTDKGDFAHCDIPELG